MAGGGGDRLACAETQGRSDLGGKAHHTSTKDWQQEYPRRERREGSQWWFGETSLGH